MANEKGGNTQTKGWRSSSKGSVGETFQVGRMISTVYLNPMPWAEVTFKVTLERKLPEGYDKPFGDTIREEDLDDAMRALYKAQRWIKHRRRRLHRSRGIILRLP